MSEEKMPTLLAEVGKITESDFKRKVRFIQFDRKSNTNWHEVHLACGHRMVMFVTVYRIGDKAWCAQCLNAWIEACKVERDALRRTCLQCGREKKLAVPHSVCRDCIESSLLQAQESHEVQPCEFVPGNI